MSASGSTAPKQKKKRPDGLDESRYKNINEWTYHQWAWEFLRRHAQYIDACKRVRLGSEEEKQSVANEFGLKKYKDYTEAYIGATGKPMFSIGSITSSSNLNTNPKRVRSRLFKIEYGQVVIRFDLGQVIQDKNALKKQLRLAEQRLKNDLAEYEAQTKQKAASIDFRPTVFGKYLRILDCLDKRLSRYEIAKTIYPSHVKKYRDALPKIIKPTHEKDIRDALVEKIKPNIKSAREIAEKYQSLSVLKGRPATKAPIKTSE